MSTHFQKPTKRPMPLSIEINEATRKAHTTLNRLITSLLPLALPPHCTAPALYCLGMLHFAPVYLAFESLWLSLLHTTPVTTPSLELPGHAEFPLLDLDPIHQALAYPKPDGDFRKCRASISLRVQKCLEQLLVPGLMRSQRLRDDLGYLTGLGMAELERLLDHPEGKQAAEFVTHIRSNVQAKPHLLVAYTWVMYMAVVSGGRWIRSQMLLAGDQFWSQPADRAGSSMSGRKARGTIGMEFFYFKGSEDGEDIKLEYKRRFAELDQLLTPSERQDIISEAIQIFHFSTLIVEELDKAFRQSTNQDTSPAQPPAHPPLKPSEQRPTQELLRTPSWTRDFRSQATKFMGRGTSPMPPFSAPAAIPTQRASYIGQEPKPENLPPHPPRPHRTSIVIWASLIIAILSIFLWLLLSRSPKFFQYSSK